MLQTRDQSVGVVSELCSEGINIGYSRGQEIFILLKTAQIQSGDHPSSYSLIAEDFFHGGEGGRVFKLSVYLL